MKYKYGDFNTTGDEFIITNPATPRAFDNFLWNDSVFSNIQQTGVGYMDYQVGENEAVQLLTGIGRICDFDVFGRDNLMSRLIYIRDNETGVYWNVNWEPVKRIYEEFNCRHGMGYSVITNKTEGIQCEFRIFIPIGNDPVELWSLKIINCSENKRDLSVFLYNQFQFKYKWGFDSYGDMIFRGAWFNKELNAVVASKHPYIKPHSFLTGFLTVDEPIASFDGSRDAFVGLYHTLNEPLAVINGNCTNTPGSSDATIGAVQLNVVLNENETKSISAILGATDEEKNIEFLRKKYLGKFEDYFTELKMNRKKLLETNQVTTPDEHLNRMMNVWIKSATSYGATWCRWGWMGYRDIVQHGLGVASFQSELTKGILLEALKYQYSHGPALRGWNPVDEKSYSDSALWLVFTVEAYLKETGDFEFLKQVISYYDCGEGNVLQHLEQALNFLEQNKGSHGLCLIKYGDWNDSLTGVGRQGKGESIMLTQTYARALQIMRELSDYLEDYEKSKDYQERYTIIKKALNDEAWDGEWYVRCFDDEGQPIGSKINQQGKIFANAQSWAMIADIADATRTEALLHSCEEELLTTHGYKLLAPTFFERDDHIGRISCLEPGVCENGTIYSHVNVWMILGLIKKGKANEAYEVFKRITPGYVMQDDHKENCPPYMFSNCYYGDDHRNNAYQMEFTWITGSVAWYYHVILNEMLGAWADYDGLIMNPCIPSVWNEYKIDRHYRGTLYRIHVLNPDHKQKGITQLTVDGRRIEGNKIPIFSDGQVHHVKVIL